MRLRLGIGVHQNGLALDAMDSPCIARVGAVAAAVVSSSRVELHVVAEVAAAQQPRHQLQRAALPNAVVGESAVVLQLLARVHQALLVEGCPSPPFPPCLRSLCAARFGTRSPSSCAS